MKEVGKVKQQLIEEGNNKNINMSDIEESMMHLNILITLMKETQSFVTSNALDVFNKVANKWSSDLEAIEKQERLMNKRNEPEI